MTTLMKKDFMLLRKYMLFIIVIVFALPVAFASKSNEVNMDQSTLAFAFEVICSEFNQTQPGVGHTCLFCRYHSL